MSRRSSKSSIVNPGSNEWTSDRNTTLKKEGCIEDMELVAVCRAVRHETKGIMFEMKREDGKKVHLRYIDVKERYPQLLIAFFETHITFQELVL